MFLELAHTKLDVFKVTKEFVLVCYRETKKFPAEDKFGMISQIRRAALSVHLNIAEGCSRKSLNERKRFYEIARGSLIEIDTAIDIAVNLTYINNEKLQPLGKLMIRAFQLISKMNTA
ncbi:MAG: four helix bundle protein [Chitinophagaceae bacterium]|nr:four helix bundle protein [Chitinophagaceae bacterium]